MSTPDYALYWLSESVQNMLTSNGIHTRDDLANAVPISRATIYRLFDEHWAGRATTCALAAMAEHFNVPLNRLVKEPALKNRTHQPIRRTA